MPDHVVLPEINTYVASNKSDDKNVEAFRVESSRKPQVMNREQRNKLWLRDKAPTVKK